jgi:Acetyltransferase (GNAT) domain
VTGTPGTDVTQLSVWARVRAVAGFRAAYLLARRDGDLVGGAQVLLRRIPGLGEIGYASYGPVLAERDGRAEAVHALAVALSRSAGVRMLFVQPAEGTDDVRAALLALGFRPSSAGIAPVGSTRLDLSPSEDEIRKAFPPRLRSWTRRWAEAGVSVRIGGEDDIPVLSELQGRAAESQGYSRPQRPDYVRRMYTELAATGNAALFVGEVHGVAVAADLVTMCGDTVRGRLSGFDRSGTGGRLSVPGARSVGDHPLGQAVGSSMAGLRWAQRADPPRARRRGTAGGRPARPRLREAAVRGPRLPLSGTGRAGPAGVAAVGLRHGQRSSVGP